MSEHCDAHLDIPHDHCVPSWMEHGGLAPVHGEDHAGESEVRTMRPNGRGPLRRGTSPRWRWVALVLGVMMAASGCGARPGVHAAFSVSPATALFDLRSR